MYFFSLKELKIDWLLQANSYMHTGQRVTTYTTVLSQQRHLVSKNCGK